MLNKQIIIPEKLIALQNTVIDNIILLRLANGAIAIIRKRTLAGKYLEGSSPAADRYSEVAMPLPLGRLQKALQKQLTKNELKNKDQYKIFKSKSGQTWIVIRGGYKAYRKLAGKFTDYVVMSWSGRMLRNMGIIRDPDGKGSEIGFPDDDVRKLALYHNVLGAGKSHRKHIFFALSKDEQTALLKSTGEDILKKILSPLS